MASKEKQYRILDDDVYDALHLSALAFGGIGAGSYGKYLDEQNGDAASRFITPGVDEVTRRPVGPSCAIGHAISVGGASSAVDARNEVVQALRAAFAGAAVESVNDTAVNNAGSPLSFSEWCKRLRVIPRSEAIARGLIEQ